MNKAFYPLHASLKNALRTVNAPLLGVRLIRRLMKTLKVSDSAVELLIGIAPRVNVGAVSLKDVRGTVGHLTIKKAQAAMDELVTAGLVEKTRDTTNPKKPEDRFRITAGGLSALASVDMDKLV